jgi:hypothetical protein
LPILQLTNFPRLTPHSAYSIELQPLTRLSSDASSLFRFKEKETADEVFTSNADLVNA